MSGELGLAHLVEGTLPEIGGEGQHVGLVHQGELPAVVAAPAVREGPAQAAVHPEAGGDHLLGGDLLRRILAQEAAGAAVEVLGVLPHHVEADVLRALVLERTFDAGVELDRSQVDVLVELETNRQQQTLFEDAGLYLGMADGAQIDGIELPQLVDLLLGDHLAGGQIAVTAVVELDPLVGDVFQRRHRLQDFAGLRGDLRPGAVARDYRQLDGVGHESAGAP